MCPLTWKTLHLNNSFFVIYRRFSVGFQHLRLERCQIKRSRNNEKLEAFESQLFNWPAKDAPEPVLAFNDGDTLGQDVQGNGGVQEGDQLGHGAGRNEGIRFN